MREGVVVRDARPGDERAVQNVVQSVLSEFNLEFDLDSQDSDLLDLSASYFDRGGCFRVIVEGDHIVGCGGLYPLATDECELRKMYVLPSVRGQGLGRELLVQLLEEARRRGMRRVTLESHSLLAAARSLYTSVGFVEVPHEHPSPRVDVAMELVL
jgi:putative acetyltransferase